MCPKLRRIFSIIRKKIYQFLSALVDIVFSIVFYNIEQMDKSVKLAIIFKLLMSALLNIVDIFQDIFYDCLFCCCCCCCCKKKDELDYQTIEIELDKQIESLEFKKKIKKKLSDEKDKQNVDYLRALSKYKSIESLEKEIIEIKIN